MRYARPIHPRVREIDDVENLHRFSGVPKNPRAALQLCPQHRVRVRCFPIPCTPWPGFPRQSAPRVRPRAVNDIPYHLASASSE